MNRKASNASTVRLFDVKVDRFMFCVNKETTPLLNICTETPFANPVKIKKELIYRTPGLRSSMKTKPQLKLPVTLRAEYDAGATFAVLAAKYHCSITPIYLRVKADGRPVRRIGTRIMPWVIEEILRRFDAGETLQKIGALYGICRERVRQIAFEHGRTPRRKLIVSAMRFSGRST